MLASRIQKLVCILLVALAMAPTFVTVAKSSTTPLIERSPCQSQGGGGGGMDGGGGVGAGAAFIEAINIAQTDAIEYSVAPQFSDLWLMLNDVLSNAQIVFAEQPLIAQYEGRAIEVVAMNAFPDSGKQVFVNRRIWSSVQDPRLKGAIAYNQLMLLMDKKIVGIAPELVSHMQMLGLSTRALLDGSDATAQSLTQEERAAWQDDRCHWSTARLQTVSAEVQSAFKTCREKDPVGYIDLKEHELARVAQVCIDSCIKDYGAGLRAQCAKIRDLALGFPRDVQEGHPACQ